MQGRRRASISLAVLGLALVLLLVLAPAAVFIAFAAGLLAVGLRGASDWLAARTAMPDRVALAVVVVLLVAVLAVGTAFAVPALGEQAQRLIERLPDSVQQLRERLQLPDWLWRLGADLAPRIGLDGLGGQAAGVAALTAGSALGALGNAAITVIMALYVAIDPALYRRGLVALLAPALRPRATLLLDELGEALRSWFAAQLVAMLAVGLMSWLGLRALGIPLPEVLGAIAFLLGFIPVIGPVVAAVPALLLAGTEGWTAVLWVAALYAGIQVLEGNLITPMVQARAVDMPPALLVITQVALGLLSGLSGLLLAAPITVAGLVLVKSGYVEAWLEADRGDDGGLVTRSAATPSPDQAARSGAAHGATVRG
jgi:predicted PurR-regulated permease PerM